MTNNSVQIILRSLSLFPFSSSNGKGSLIAHRYSPFFAPDGIDSLLFIIALIIAIPSFSFLRYARRFQLWLLMRRRGVDVRAYSYFRGILCYYISLPTCDVCSFIIITIINAILIYYRVCENPSFVSTLTYCIRFQCQ